MASLVSPAHAEPTPYSGFTTYYIYQQPFAPPALHDHRHHPIIMLFFYPPPPPPPSNLSNTANYMEAHHPPSTSRSSEGRLVHRRKYKPKPSSPVVIPFPCTTPQQVTTCSPTTLMIKNIPNNIGRTSFLRILKRHCWEENRSRKADDPNISMFDFLYLPIDFRRKTISNLGYAFVNFTTPAAAWRFYRHFHCRKWNGLSQKSKTCEVTCAKIQGKRALLSNFKHKKFWCNREECLPVIVEPACDGAEWPEIYTVGKLAGAYI